VDLSTGGPTSCLWEFGDGSTSTLQSPVHVYAAEGSYDVRLTLANSVSTSSLLRPAYVGVSPPLPIATFAPVADAKVSSGNPATNYGSAPDLRLKSGTRRGGASCASTSRASTRPSCARRCASSWTARAPKRSTRRSS
jgi:PKD repeat protein